VVIPRRGYFAAIEQRSPFLTFYDCKTGNIKASMRCKVLSIAAIDAQPLYAEPSDLVCAISGYRQ
jgi:hypothetical protein